jgi:hypothetical protein
VSNTHKPISDPQDEDTQGLEVVEGSFAIKIWNAMEDFNTSDPSTIAGITSLPLKIVEEEMDRIADTGVFERKQVQRKD